MCAVASPSCLATAMESNLEDPLDVFSPTADLGVDFEVILRMCIEEQQRKDPPFEQQIPCINEKQVRWSGNVHKINLSFTIFCHPDYL